MEEGESSRIAHWPCTCMYLQCNFGVLGNTNRVFSFQMHERKKNYCAVKSPTGFLASVYIFVYNIKTLMKNAHFPNLRFASFKFCIIVMRFHRGVSHYFLNIVLFMADFFFFFLANQ